MRIIAFLILCLPFVLLADAYTVFEENGKFGLQNDAGEKVVPALYDRLGWSNGSEEVIDNVIGYQRGRLWGLVTVKNKILLENSLYTINPLRDDLLIAAIKGRFSNHLFHGIINTKGEVLISFNYFDLQELGDAFVATEFDQYQSKQGIVNLENKVNIPIRYRSITALSDWHMAFRFDGKVDLYHKGFIAQYALDSIQMNRGMICFRGGRAGYLTADGIQEHAFGYKNFREEESQVHPVQFADWQVFDGDSLVLERSCDSLTLQDEFWVMHLNGARHKVYASDQFDVSSDSEIREIIEDRVLIQSNLTQLYSVIDNSGKAVLEEQEMVYPSGRHFFAMKNGGWSLYSWFGNKLSRFQYESIAKGVDNNFIARKNGWWGVIDFRGKTYIKFKYDSIKTADNGYLAKFHEKWGYLDKHGNWKIFPEYDELSTAGTLIVGKRGEAFTYFIGEQELFKSTDRIISSFDRFQLVLSEYGKYGLLDDRGTVVAQSAFDTIKMVDAYLVFATGGTAALSAKDGQMIVPAEDEYQDFGEVGDGYITARKNDRWGLLDLQGRLRISNRYEDVQPFSEGMAAMKLRGRWGFIDEDEVLRVQPHYDWVSPFAEGVAIVLDGGKFGLIDKDGGQVIEAIWDSIERTKLGNYVIRDGENKVGLASPNGSFILRPGFEKVIDLREGIIVQNAGKLGLLSYDGMQIFKMLYSDMRNEKHFILLSK